MPHSQYIPGHEPPGIVDRVLIHSFGVSLAAGAGVVAALLLASIHAEVSVSRALDDLHWISLILLALALGAGSYLALRGVAFPNPEWDKLDALNDEMAGSIALCLSWMAFSLSVLASGNHYGAITVVLAGCVGNGYLLRTIALGLSKRRIKLRREAEDQLKE